MDDKTNIDRWRRAATALTPYAQANNDAPDNVVDLLTDLRHWCRFRLNFDDAVERSRIHFEAEAYGQPE